MKLNDQEICLLISPCDTKIRYKGSLGYDGGGLTREFFEIFYEEIKKYFKTDKNGYIVPLSDDNPKLYDIIGTVLARGIFYENIRSELNLHPLIINQMLYSDMFHNFDDLTQKYDLEEFYNLQKIYEMPDSEYSDFLKLQDIEYTNRDDYSYSVIKDILSYDNNMINFITGFAKCVLVYDPKILNIDFDYIYNFICNSDKYELNVSMDYTNKIESCFFDSFLDVLRTEYNYNNMDKLRKLLVFWTGTSRKVNDKLLLNFTNSNTYGCVISRTCYNALYFDKNILKEKNIKDAIRISIEKSLLNQDIHIRVGMYMQFE